MEEVTDRIAAGETKAEIIRRAEAEGKGYKAAAEHFNRLAGVKIY